MIRPRQVGRSLLLDDGTAWPALAGQDLYDAIESIPHPQRYHARAILSAYAHLAAHPAGTESAVKSLRSLRRAVVATTTTKEKTQ